jgi:hypothetical protein
MSKENGLEAPNRVGAMNRDGTQDFGCFMLNNRYQAQFFASNNWADPVANSRHAFSIFQARGNWSAWYAVCTPNRVPKYPGIWCNQLNKALNG